MSTTTNLEDFGFRELKMAGELLSAYKDYDKDKTRFFDSEGVHVMFNMNSGYVFLTNSEYQVAMLNGDKLEDFFTCPICGHEGFLEDMVHGEDDHECQEYLQDIAA